jgi:gliding motility-associated-like protein
MKYIYILCTLFFLSLFAQAQVVTDNSNTVEYYIQNVLLGSGVSVSNITINGNPANVNEPMVGEFTDASSSIGLPNGLILGSGDIDLASQNNTSGSSSLGGGGNSGQDPDLSVIATNTLYDQTIVEFDFIPLGDTLSFNYVFASEEYNEFVCSGYNDVFGFFLTGTNPLGGTYNSQNIALVPNPSIPGTYTNTAVAINTINLGVAGSSGTASNCNAIDPAWTSYNVFYVNHPGVSNYTYDGRTVSLPVIAPVVCGLTYHIKMAIADAGDGGYDSGVFLEAGSFSSNGALDATTADVPSNIQLCGSPFNVTFNTGPNPPPASYWDLGDGTILTNLDTVNHTYADSGTYVVMYVADDPSPCVQADTAYFTVDVIQTGTLDAQIDIPPYNPCQDSLTIQLAFTGSGADSLYWDMGNGDIFINDTLISYTYYTNGDYILTFQAYDFACGGFNTIKDTIRFNPVFTAVTATTPGDQEFCGAPFNVDFTSGGTPPPNSFWDFGDIAPNDTSTLDNVTYTYADTGSYTVMYVAIDSNTCNIADTAYFDITLTPAEVLDAQFTIPPYNDCQDSLTVSLAFTGTGADSLYWSMGEGTTYINDTLVNHTYTSNGDFIVTFEAYDLQCNTSATLTDTVHFNPVFTAVTAVVPDSINECEGNLTVDFSSGNPGPPQNIWDFGDGVGTSTQIDPTYTYASNGTYTVTFTAIDSSTCNIYETASFDVVINSLPAINVSMDYVPPVPCEAVDYKVELAASLANADSIFWDMGDGTTFSGDTVISYEYATFGNYTIVVTLFNDDCGAKSFSYNADFIELEESSGIIPNVFTPNGDGMNDELVFLGIDQTQDYSIRIFNRWGQTVFESTDAQDNWDGKGSNDGTYFYELRYTDVCSNEEKLVTGYVTLIGKN